uniref:Nucleotide exchange factor Fes1 domain-containing protein n=1 Tax=Cuerna arida TaxID=1464854 RepID=A0A1B6ET86_9HEMI
MSSAHQRTESSGDDHPSVHPSSEEARPNVEGNIHSPSTSTSLVPVVNDVNSSASEMPQEQPKNLQELLRLSTMLQSSYNEGDSGSSSRPSTTISEDREDFLRNALANLSVDVISNLKEQLQILNEITDGNQPITNLERYENTFERITDHVFNIDMANVFYQIGGMEVIVKLLRHPLGLIRWRAASIISECCQNNPYCKSRSLSDDLFSLLMNMALNNPDSNCQFKAISAISAIVGDNAEGINQFKKHNGLKIINHGLNSGNEKMIVKTAFLIMALCNTDPTMKDELIHTPIVENLLTLTRLTDTLFAEHLLSALLTLIRNNDAAIKQCLRKELGLCDYLKQSISLTSNDESFQDYVAHASELLQILKDYEIRECKENMKNGDMDFSTSEQST